MFKKKLNLSQGRIWKNVYLQEQSTKIYTCASVCSSINFFKNQNYKTILIIKH